jgi:hypothetical protein
MQRSAALALLMMLTGIIGGCGGRSDRVPVYPVRGKVIFSAPAAANAMVVFHPVGNPDPKVHRPFATLNKDGSFELSTYDSKDGAPEGEYAVTLTWELPGKSGDDDDSGPDLLRNTVYSDPAKTPLKATIKPGRNELDPFLIKK